MCALSSKLLALPSELRSQILQYLLCVKEEIDPWNHVNRDSLTLGPLFANKTANTHASEILYGENCFNFVMSTSSQIASFLAQIGENKGKIKHTHIDIRTNPTSSLLALGPDSVKTIALIQEHCTNLKTVIISVPEIKNREAGAVFRSAVAHFNKDIAVKTSNIEADADPRSSNTNQYIEAKMQVFEPFLNPDMFRSHCPRLSLCDTHEHILDWIPGSARMEPCSFRDICLRILLHAQGIEEPLMPNGQKTRISANRKLCSIQWQPFTMRIFCDPVPTTALQATLALILFEMSSYTGSRSQSLGYGKFPPPSRLVFSRRDIQSTFPRARALDLEGMCQTIKLIRILDFLDERKEHEEDDRIKGERKRKRGEEEEEGRGRGRRGG